jgi:hypothetical protein
MKAVGNNSGNATTDSEKFRKCPYVQTEQELQSQGCKTLIERYTEEGS